MVFFSRVNVFSFAAETFRVFILIFVLKTCVQPKKYFFTWEDIWGKILTCDQLQRRGFTPVNRCLLCYVSDETTNHLLVECIKTRPLWELLLSLFGAMWVNPKWVWDTLLIWNNFVIGRKCERAWRAGPL